MKTLVSIMEHPISLWVVVISSMASFYIGVLAISLCKINK